jgi:hypothetical protein
MDEPSDRQRWPALEKDEAGLLNELLALLTARVVGNPYATDGSFAANIAGRAVRFHRPDNWRDGNRQGTCCTGYPPAIKARLARFVTVNCAAIPRDLIASELFGHEKGAFTGATYQRLGRFELSSGGRSFSMRLENDRPRSRLLSCVFCRNTSLSGLVALAEFGLTFG